MEIDFITNHHKQTKRDYLARVNKINKSEAAMKAKKWDFDYWDGSRDINYGGYYYDGRWEPIAKKIIDFVKTQGAMPADWCINDGILDVQFDLNNKVIFDSKEFSFTKDLK